MATLRVEIPAENKKPGFLHEAETKARAAIADILVSLGRIVKEEDVVQLANVLEKAALDVQTKLGKLRKS